MGDPNGLAAAIEHGCDVNAASRRERFMVWWALRFRRPAVERQLTSHAMSVGAIPPTACSDGVFVGNWFADLLDYIIENWDEILAIITSILLLF